jgi:arsenate reductase
MNENNLFPRTETNPLPDPRIPDRSPADGTPGKPRVLFICEHNSARSQMAEGYLRARYPDRFTAASAGSKPRGVHPLAIAVMDEIGIDISGHASKNLEEFTGKGIDIVVTVCECGHQTCPFFPGVRERIHAGFPDPSGDEGTFRERIARFREVRDAIITWIDTTFVPGFGRIPPRP